MVSGIALALRVLTSRLWLKKHLDQTPATHKGFSKMWFSFSLARACNQRMWRSLARARMCDKVCACLFPDRAGLYQPSPQEMTGCLLWSPCRVFHYSYYLWRRETSDKYPSYTHTHMHVHRHRHTCTAVVLHSPSGAHYSEPCHQMPLRMQNKRLLA